MQKIIREIQALKIAKKVLILAHVYQTPEVQEIADYVGDSLGLARQAAATDADIIAFCGVRFMAETAAILNPDKKVLLPDLNAGCPMAMMASAQDVEKLKSSHPGAQVITYVNSTAEVKAVSDICCTSSNAIRVVGSSSSHDIIFVPDRNLGQYVQSHFPHKNIILWDGFCPTHDDILPEDVRQAKKQYPDAVVMVHPECRPDVIKYADFVGSTTEIISFAHRSKARNHIVCTEQGVLHPLQKNNPDKAFYPVTQKTICPTMKYTTLELLRDVMETGKNQITVEPEIAARARTAIEAMLRIS